ncbi:MAG: hypothetical protein GY896_08130 [Gammaproteobacteria bacterium]|nr:hypothetical protein [Gammaproteobacteria bacterium]
MKLTDSAHTGILVGIGILASAVSFYFSLSPLEVSLFNGEYHLSNYDAFYHARLIQDTIDQFPKILEFDPSLHPLDGGAWISVAWGYEYLMALICLVLQAFNPELKTSTILAHIAPCWSLINCLLIVGICRALGLNLIMTGIGALGFALSPLTQDTHLIGNIDHHFIELSFILLITFCALRWIERNQSKQAAVVLGISLGLANAFHIALFLMYVPLGIFLLINWIRGRDEVLTTANDLAAATMLCTILVVVPSVHFRQLEFVYYFTSWFHLYWALAFCLSVVFFKYASFSRRNLVLFGIAVALALLPIFDSLRHGLDFIGSELPGFSQLEETYSIFSILFSGDSKYLGQFYEYYSGLIFLLPFSLILFARLVVVQQRQEQIYFLVAILIGAILMFSQLRFKYHASYILLIPLLVVIQNWKQAGQEHKLIITILLFIGCFIGPINRLNETRPLGGQGAYRALLPFYQAIGRQCQTLPGVLLAHPDEGHYLRFHSDCVIVASNLLATPKDFEYRALAFKLFQMPLAQLLQQNDWVDYIYVRREDGFLPNLDAAAITAMNRGLRENILLKGTPDQVKLLYEIPTQKGPFVRLVYTGDE